MDDNQNTNNDTSNLSSQYQSILDKYAADLSVNPPTPQAPPTEPVNPEPVDTQPDVIFAPISQPSLETPEPELNLEAQSQSPEPIMPTFTPPSPDVSVRSVPKQNKFFKVFFFISLLIFLVVLGANLYTYFIVAPKSDTSNVPTLAPKPTETASAQVCEINYQSYDVGQTFPAQDECNTCTCLTDLTISCTSEICPTAGPTKKPVPLTLTSVYPTSGTIASKITLYGTGFDKTANSVAFVSTDIVNNNCTYTYDKLPSPDGQKITLSLDIPPTIKCGGGDLDPNVQDPTQLLPAIYEVSVNNATSSSYTKDKLVKFTVKK